MAVSTLQRPVPSRLTLIRLRAQEATYRRVRRTVEDARNATLQRLRTLIPSLEERRKVAFDVIGRVSELYEAAKLRLGPERTSFIASTTRPRVEGFIEDRVIGGLKFSMLSVKGVGGPSYGLYSIPPELDSALTLLTERMPELLDYVNLENVFYTLLRRVREYQRMINALDNVILPRIRDSISFIRLALDELEREDFIRRVIINRIIAGG